MSQRNRKYKRIEALFSKSLPVAPDSTLRDAAKNSEPGTSAEDLTGLVGDTRLESVVPPTAVSPVNRGQKTGFTYDREKVTSMEEASLPPPENALRVSLMVSGTPIGTIQVAGNEAGWTAQEIEIISAVAVQLARHIENLRLSEQREKNP